RVAELVADVQDRPEHVEPVGAAGSRPVLPPVREALVGRLAVATDRNAPGGAVDLGRGGGQARNGRGGLRLLGTLRTRFLDLRGQEVDATLELLQTLPRRALCLEPRQLLLKRLDLFRKVLRGG